MTETHTAAESFDSQAPWPVECPFCARVTNGQFDFTEIRLVHAFAPLNPVTDGHMLFIPKWHITHPNPAWAADCVEAAQLYAMRHKIEQFNIITSCGPDATQSVDHMHIHLVPRRKDDGLHLPWTGQKPLPRLQDVAEDEWGR